MTNSETSLLYDDAFFKKRLKHREWQSQIGFLLCLTFRIQSVLDLGCALGSYLEGFRSCKAIVKGYELYRDCARSYIPSGIAHCVFLGDVTKPIYEECKYDCCFSMEVAEHIPSESSEVFVDNLCNNSERLIIMSAAPPGQGGIGHINCQSYNYWIEKIESRGFYYSKNGTVKASKIVENIPKVPKWVKQNLMVFCKMRKIQRDRNSIIFCKKKMKIYISYTDKNQTAGKTKFLKRLAMQFQNDGYYVTNHPHEKVDVGLHRKKIKRGKTKINILRLDGVYFDTRLKWRKKNLSIKQQFKNIDGVVYQSQWAKAMCDKYLGEFDGPTNVILNGANLSFYEQAVPIDVSCKYLFFTSARWRRFKRLKDIIESFIEAGISNSELHIAGDLKSSGLELEDYKKYRIGEKIKFCGILNDIQIARYLKRATAFLHLSRFDACPNGVVEAVAAKTRVICGNITGPKEIVEPSGGIICDIEESYDMEPVDVYKVPFIDKQKVIDAMWKAIRARKSITNNHVDIANISCQYYDFFQLCASKI